MFASSLRFEKLCFHRFSNQNIVLWQLTNYKHISLVFSKYGSKTTRRQSLQNKDNRTNRGPEVFCNLLTGKFGHILFDHVSNSPDILVLFKFL